MEYLDLYDINRMRTGKTFVRGEKPKNGYYLVVQVILFNTQGKMLIQQRQSDKVGWPDKWDVSAGGSAQAGETSQQAASRELREELGLEMDFSGVRPNVSSTFPEGFTDVYLVEKEVSIMGKALADPTRPFVAILGGAKVSDKLNVINNLLEKVDTLIIGGGMAYTFLAAKGYSVGNSLLDNEKIDYCREMMDKAAARGVKLLLPVDTVVAASFPNPIDAEIEVRTVPADAIPDEMEGLDIGEATRALFADAVKNAKTVVWNGPMGVFENPILAKGTIAVAQALADSDAVTIVGGGDSAAACEQLGFAQKITHISTGGGASLEFLEGLELPGIACLQDR